MENIKIQKALKNMVDHMVILNDDEILSSSTLSTMAIDALCEDSEYCDLVDRDSAEAYLDKIVNFLDSKGLTFYTTNILDIEICSECGAVLLPDDECYQDHETGLPLCDKCSVQCRGCGNAIARSKVSAGAEYYCQSCNANTSNNNPNQNTCFNANDYTTHQLLEIEFQNVPNSTHKDNLIDEALQLVEECGYAVGEAANEVKVPICEDQKESILDELKCSEYKHLLLH